MTAPTDRELQILRLLDAGVALKKRTNSGDRFGAVFDFARISQNVLGPTLHALLRRGWLTFDPDQQRFLLTPNGREHVALRTRVRDFAQSQSK
jgi:DNA-binding PadR family transcriptional regulator